jgi:hypothetical protein
MMLGKMTNTMLMTIVVAMPMQAAEARDATEESYVAYLGSDDHFNSAGRRLTSAAAVLRQDRVNFHGGLGDPADEDDSFFDSKANRERMERLLENGALPRAVENAIVNGQPTVLIRIGARSMTVKLLMD